METEAIRRIVEGDRRAPAPRPGHPLDEDAAVIEASGGVPILQVEGLDVPEAWNPSPRWGLAAWLRISGAPAEP